MDRLSSLISISPVICSTHAILSDEEVLWIVNIFIWTCLNAVDDLCQSELACLSCTPHPPPLQLFGRTHTRFKIYQNGSRDISRVVGLVKEHILPIAAFSGKVLEVSILTDTVFLTELLPKLTANYCEDESAQNPDKGETNYILTAVTTLASLYCNYFSGHCCDINRVCGLEIVLRST